LGAVAGAGIAQHFGMQALAHAPIQPRQFRIHCTSQPLAAAANKGAQFGVQGLGRCGRCPGRDVVHICKPFAPPSKAVALINVAMLPGPFYYSFSVTNAL
jgi:hypothetical protein